MLNCILLMSKIENILRIPAGTPGITEKDIVDPLQNK